MTSKISFIGGDIRMPEAAKFAAKKFDNILIYGFDSFKYCYDCFGIKQENNFASALDGVDIVVFGLPYSADGKNIFAPYSEKSIPIDDVISQLNDGAKIFGGILNKYIEEKAAKKNIKCFDYFKREELTLKNALITAEGALAVAMNETSHTIHSSNCLVIGYGRIGKMLSDMLRKLNANVSASARKESDLALIECCGINAVKTNEIGKNIADYDIIFNTVPVCLLTKDILENVRDDTLIIDLASKPGGMDFESARYLGKKIIWATSLPGKVAPETSGKIISDTIYNILNE